MAIQKNFLTFDDAKTFTHLLPEGHVYKEIPNATGYWAGTDGSIWRFRTGRKREIPKPKWSRIKAVFDPSCNSLVLNVGCKTLGQFHHVYLGVTILETFVGPRPPDMECCHFPDRDIKKCSLNNLCWGTSKENHRHQYIHGTRVLGERHPQCKLTDAEVTEIVANRHKIPGLELAKNFKISRGYVYYLWCYGGRGGKKKKE